MTAPAPECDGADCPACNAVGMHCPGCREVAALKESVTDYQYANARAAVSEARWKDRAEALEAERNGWEQTANEHGMALAKAEAALKSRIEWIDLVGEECTSFEMLMRMMSDDEEEHDEARAALAKKEG